MRSSLVPNLIVLPDLTCYVILATDSFCVAVIQELCRVAYDPLSPVHDLILWCQVLIMWLPPLEFLSPWDTVVGQVTSYCLLSIRRLLTDHKTYCGWSGDFIDHMTHCSWSGDILLITWLTTVDQVTLLITWPTVVDQVTHCTCWTRWSCQ